MKLCGAGRFLLAILCIQWCLGTRLRASLRMGTGNTLGKIFRVTTFGESHGPVVGAVIDGCPPRVKLNLADIQKDLSRRRPGQSRISTPRSEDDCFELVSGVDDRGYTLGTPLTLIVKNKDQRSRDYEANALKYRPSHADATYDSKYGIRAISGGGRASARETVARVAAGAVAKQILRLYSNVEIIAYVSQLHTIEAEGIHPDAVTQEMVESNVVRCPDAVAAKKMEQAIDRCRLRGDSLGGVVEVVARNVPSGWGSPVFDKLEAELAKACMSIPASKGFEIGSGFAGTRMTGQQHNDEFFSDASGRTRTRTNRSGGIQGGISNGENIVARVAFKPTSTIHLSQATVSRDGVDTTISGTGRHDPCVLPRAVPIVEAMVALVLVDALMQHSAQCELFAQHPHSAELLPPVPIHLGKASKIV